MAGWRGGNPRLGAPSRFGRFRRKIDDAKDRAAARRHDADIDRGPVGTAGKVGGRLIRDPQ